VQTSPAGLARLAGTRDAKIVSASSPSFETTPATRVTTESAVRLGTCFIDRKRPTLKILAVQPSNGSLGLIVIVHFDKRESPRFSGITVSHDSHLRNLAELREVYT